MEPMRVCDLFNLIQELEGMNEELSRVIAKLVPLNYGNRTKDALYRYDEVKRNISLSRYSVWLLPVIDDAHKQILESIRKGEELSVHSVKNSMYGKLLVLRSSLFDVLNNCETGVDLPPELHMEIARFFLG